MKNLLKQWSGENFDKDLNPAWVLWRKLTSPEASLENNDWCSIEFDLWFKSHWDECLRWLDCPERNSYYGTEGTGPKISRKEFDNWMYTKYVKGEE